MYWYTIFILDLVGNATLYQKHAGRSHGLRLVMNIEADEYTTMNPEPDIGLKFRIHEPDEPPDIEARGVAVPAGYHAFARLKYNEVSKSNILIYSIKDHQLIMI